MPADGIDRAVDPVGLIAEVLVSLPVPLVFDYAVPADLAGRLAAGQRVWIPFRGRRRVGVVVGTAGTPRPRLRPIESLLDPVPALTPSLLELGRRVARETVSSWGEVIGAAMPPPVAASRPVPPPVAVPREPTGGPASRPLVLACGRERDGLVELTAERAVGTGRGVLLLAPEIETARRWADRLERRLGEPVVLMTSAETPRQRWTGWWALREGRQRVAVGTRAALFAPVAPLGAVVVVDEHHPAHKAEDPPRWHARDVALRRAGLEGSPCLLASGAPSLESWVRAQRGSATVRDTGVAPWPIVERVDLRRERGPGCLTPALRDAIRASLAGGQGALLLLNGLGYGRALGCAECGAVRRCPTCRVALTYHLRARALECRWCGVRRPAASLCARCRGRRLMPLGWGTERVEAEARAAFPAFAVARYDGSVPPAAAAAAREAFRAGRVRLIVGTRMALPLVADAAIGIAALVLADATLSLPDFRAGERTFQLGWHLAEGVRAGGSLWIQSYYPDHPALEGVARGEREAFYRREWAERQELGYPPARRMARVTAQGRDAARLAQDLGKGCREAGLVVLGPTPLPGGRLRLVTLGDDGLPEVLAGLLGPLRGHRRIRGGRLAVDVDPVEG